MTIPKYLTTVTPFSKYLAMFLFILLPFVGFYLGIQYQQSLTRAILKSPTQIITTKLSTTDIPINISPKFVAFMRKGEIWMKDFQTNKEQKVSTTEPVDEPNISFDGKYVSYFSLVHASDGFPVTPLYIADTLNKTEIEIGKGNAASRLHWAKDAAYIGFISFGNPAQAVLFDASTKKAILKKDIANLKDAHFAVEKAYNTSLDCLALEIKYQAFCKEYEAVLQKTFTYENQGYKRETYQKSPYTKTDYSLVRSVKLQNGLVVLEYYTGEPQNPESKWGMGSFIPGYDEGVTNTYTILLDEKKNTVITELPLTVHTDFVF